MKHAFSAFAASLVVLILWTAMAAAIETPFFQTEPVFEFDEARPSNHASSIAVMPNGDLLATWFGGTHEGLPDVSLWAARRIPDGQWSQPYVLVSDPKKALGNSVLFVDSKGVVWLFYVIKYGEGWADWGTCQIFLQNSSDSGVTWSAPRQITTQLGYIIRANAIETPDGEIMLPLYIEDPAQPMQSVIWVSDDGFKSWREYRIPVTEPANLQPSVTPLDENNYILFARHHTVPGKIWVSLSNDRGKTWKEPFKHRLNNPDSGIALITLHSGALVLAWNDNKFVRTPLKVALSEDGGKTWPLEKTLESASGEFSYPFLVQAPDGIIHLTYTSDNRKLITHTAFNETWLRSRD